MNEDYEKGAVITGLLVFIAVWLYAIANWGLLIGLVIGWLPALIAGAVLGVIWPVPALIACGLVLVMVHAH